MGTIQSARFLSHTGHILPGVRRALRVPTPAAGTDWSVTVPAGVQWNVRAGVGTLTTAAVAGSRYAGASVTVDGVATWQANLPAGQAESLAYVYTLAATVSAAVTTVAASGLIVPLPNLWLPEGTAIGSSTIGLLAGDQWSAIALTVEEVYVTNSQLSELERASEAETLKLERTMAAALAANNGA